MDGGRDRWAAAAAAAAVAVAGAYCVSAAAGPPRPPPVQEMRRRFGLLGFGPPRVLGSMVLGIAAESLGLLPDPRRLEPAPTDVVVAVPGKSGTTWLMHMAHQLRMEAAPPDFDDQMDVIPVRARSARLQFATFPPWVYVLLVCLVDPAGARRRLGPGPERPAGRALPGLQEPCALRAAAVHTGGEAGLLLPGPARRHDLGLQVHE